MSRKFTIPCDSPFQSSLKITLIEPSLTADNLGHKTWLSSYLLACRLPRLFARHFNPVQKPLRMLELGSGTGLLGIAAAALLPSAETCLTDLPEIIGNLENNALANANYFTKARIPRVEVLDWSIPIDEHCVQRYDIILASDPLYSPLHPEWLVRTIYERLSAVSLARVFIELPLRDAYLGEVDEMRTRLLEGGLAQLDSGEESGREDWDGPNSAEVRCWWGVWGWDDASA